MKIFSFMLYVVGICFCIAGFIGHYPAFAGATLSFFATTMIAISQGKTKKKMK
ncbi:Uncharacterised protein [Clostridioides difficile]|uniref:hypothetical protein n=1 Tax=Clostridioides difficile TaxID=1496 RepID=UPI000D1EB287|nr:hypothetical protein [Clostridioides difficile]UWD40426.1 hypothetical protein NYF05_13820 [Clostridioides difficile]UWD44211.1 hypothetical protein NYU56_13585 [Clostridioides difficile]VFF94319.1 Uncharacterised protein [Clostridioides difficile]VIF94804.1 Uncharacterised protein [Clostridioides difficile]VIG02232.1 Uncharacterised protein [Clostridioides difficile]